MRVGESPLFILREGVTVCGAGPPGKTAIFGILRRQWSRSTGKVVDAVTKKEQYEARTEELLLPILKEYGFELVDVEYIKEAGTWYLRNYIDKEGGITIDDCELVSRALGEKLDQEDFIEDSYIMEVSSPGLGRPLKKERDFQRSLGEEVEIRLFRPIDQEKEYIGALAAYDKDTVTIELEDMSQLKIDRKNIALIRLAFDF